ncbi:peptide chain release factor N(5)-glutamine methyltransferase [Sinimarinibacterium thermocellulolyticum]|uniref:Release factor glutamine methyltransferase n=1 Tax=Sinimarinibacterium thermocellulolyticum TaxID=3170016 RepID=A0ABV2AB77_9GAMM
MRLGEALMAAQARIAPVSDSPRLDAELLYAHVSGLGRAQQLARLHSAVEAGDLARFEALVARRARGEPVAYLTGSRGFWTLDLRVSPAVLVPRPETELLVEWGLELLAGRHAPRIADLGTGSGAIALALASERADARIVATDVSAAALAVARANAQALGFDRVTFVEGHWFEALPPGAFDLLVSNPPYIAHDDPHLVDLRFEPLQALTDGADGLNALREIVGGAMRHVVDDGWLLVEHGHDQAAAVRALFAEAGFCDIATRSDYAARERATAARARRA